MGKTNMKISTQGGLMALLMGGTALATTGLGGVALAQEGATVRDVITVTATRREETVSDVPYNISAVGGEAIEAGKILDEAELLRSIPGVTVVDRGARNSGTMNAARIRGLAVDGNALGDYAVSSVASVSTYVNDTPIFANFALRDLERVEVLRGPQGTLWGKNTTGGAMNFISRLPGDALEGEALHGRGGERLHRPGEQDVEPDGGARGACPDERRTAEQLTSHPPRAARC